VVLIGFFERGDDEHQLTAEKMLYNKNFIKKIDRFIRFCTTLFLYGQETKRCLMFVNKSGM